MQVFMNLRTRRDMCLRVPGRFGAARLALFLSLGALVLPPAAQAVHPMVVQEDSYELKLADTRWPDTARGAVQLPGCVRCKQDRYTLGANARFLVGRQPVGYGEFLAAVRGGRMTAVFIAIERSTGEVSRATVMP
jgi:hypothetical protein